MSYYTEPEDSQNTWEKVKVVLDLSHYLTKKIISDATGADTSNLSTKSYFIALKEKFDKVDISKLANVPISLIHSKTKVDDLDVGKWKTVLIRIEKINWCSE